MKLLPFLHLVLFLVADSILCDQYENNGSENELACPYDRVCTAVDYCPNVVSLMFQKTLPVHRFRLAVCGYEGTTVKVCCSPSPDIYSLQNGLRGSSARSGLTPECGMSFVPFDTNAVCLGSFPFLARMGFINVNNGEMKFPCSGTIIDARTVLTTATCALAQTDDFRLESVLVGEYNTATDPDCTDMFCGLRPVCHKISYVVKHPGYDQETFANNIALVRLQEPMNFTVTVQPACVSTGRDFNLMAMDEVRLFGWGQLANNQQSTKGPSSQQQALNMRLVSRQECADFSNQGLCVELCAIGEQEPCSGFSGSPLIRMNRDKYTVIGILSYGSTCRDSRNNPVAFVDVRRYADWIAQN